MELDEASLKSGVGVTVSVKVAVWTTEPEVALSVMTDEVTTAEALTLIDTVEEPAALMVVGEKDNVVPAGTPLAESDTAELKPPTTVVVAVSEPEAPCMMLSVLTDEAMEKAGA